MQWTYEYLGLYRKEYFQNFFLGICVSLLGARSKIILRSTGARKQKLYIKVIEIFPCFYTLTQIK